MHYIFCGKLKLINVYIVPFLPDKEAQDKNPHTGLEKPKWPLILGALDCGQSSQDRNADGIGGTYTETHNNMTEINIPFMFMVLQAYNILTKILPQNSVFITNLEAKVL